MTMNWSATTWCDECDHEAHGEFCLHSEPIEPKETETVGVAFRWSSCACEAGMRFLPRPHR
jgi:hypothetical protein